MAAHELPFDGNWETLNENMVQSESGNSRNTEYILMYIIFKYSLLAHDDLSHYYCFAVYL